MKVTLIYLLLISLALPPIKQKIITVEIIVKGGDDNINNRIKSKISTELRSKSSTIISNKDPLFIITLNSTIIRPESKIIGLTMSTLLTKKITTNEGRITYEVLSNVVNTLNITDLDIKCTELVARFDTNYFDQERN